MCPKLKNPNGNLPEFELLQELKSSFGYKKIIGLDEVGRGAIAGPLVVAAVEVGADVVGVTDSKKLSVSQRELIGHKLVSFSNQISLGIVSNEEIDKLGLAQAQKLAYQRALEKMDGDIFLTDFVKLPKPYKNIRAIKGEDLFYPVAAASILAKVYRDQLMRCYHRFFPKYGWNTNVGYGSISHQISITELGPTPLHRHSFLKKISPKSIDN